MMKPIHVAVYNVVESFNNRAGYTALTVEFVPGKQFRVLYYRIPILYESDIVVSNTLMLETSVEIAINKALKLQTFNPIEFQPETKELLTHFDSFSTAMRVRLIEKDKQGFSNWKMHDTQTVRNRIEIRCNRLYREDVRVLQGIANWAFIGYTNLKIKNNGTDQETSSDN